MNTIKRTLTQACVVLVIVLALLAGVEITARLGRDAKARLASLIELTGDPLVLKQPWGRQLLSDQWRLRFRHESYVEFRETEMTSATVNVSGDGTRRVSETCRGPDQPRVILLFGGSTMFGYGVPDQFTIPAYLAKEFNRSGDCVRLINYGSGWWQSSQSVTQLLKVLRSGVRPSAVVFYDGINEVDVVTFGGSPGGLAPGAEIALANAFQDDMGWRKFIRDSIAVRAISRWVFGERIKSAVDLRLLEKAKIPETARSISQVYVQNVRIVEALAKEYGFVAHFFLQPHPLIAGKVNTEMEDAVIKRRLNELEGEADLIRAVYEEWRNDPYLKRLDRFRDISRLFEGMTQELYADTEHLLPEGNRLVAERMSRELALR